MSHQSVGSRLQSGGSARGPQATLNEAIENMCVLKNYYTKSASPGPVAPLCAPLTLGSQAPFADNSALYGRFLVDTP